MNSAKKLMLLGFTVGIMLWFAQTVQAQTAPNFSGMWKQDGAHSNPVRTSNVTLHILQRDPAFTVETTILSEKKPKQSAVQRYTTDGKESVTKGADGDTFYTKIVWKGQELSFVIVEHEDGEIINSTETWSLIDNGATLKREIRAAYIGEGEHVILYRRIGKGL